MYKNHIDKLRQNFIKAYNDGDFLKAILTGERILKIYEDNNGTQTSYFADDAFNLAIVYSDEGKFSKSTQIYELAANVIKNVYGKTLKYSNILNNLAIDLNLMGKHEDSLECFKEVYEVRKSVLEKGHKDLIDSIFNLGGAYFDIENFDEALKYHKEALSLRDKNDLDYADNLNMIGYDYEEMGDFEKGAEYFQEALCIIKKTEGTRSEEYFKNLYYLGFIYEKAENYVEAKNCYEKSVELIKLHIGETHPYYAESLNKLANMHLKCGNENKALTLRMKALNLIKNLVGENHLYYASNLKNIADIYLQKEDFVRAEKMYLEELEIKKKILGEDSEEYFNDLNSLCKLYIKSQNFEKASDLIDSIISNPSPKINKKLYFSFLLDLAYLHIKTCNTDDLRSIYEKFNEFNPSLAFEDFISNIRSFDSIEEYLQNENAKLNKSNKFNDFDNFDEFDETDDFFNFNEFDESDEPDDFDDN